MSDRTDSPAPTWTPPARGYWRRDFRIPEWIPAPVSTSFATWAIPLLDAGFEDALRADLGMGFETPATAVVDGWCFARDPKPTRLGTALRRSPGRMLRIAAAVATWPSRPERYERAVAEPAHRRYLEVERPAHMARVQAASAEVDERDVSELPRLIDELVRSTGTYELGMVQALGFAGKAEFALARFYADRLRPTLGGSHLPLVSGLLGDPSASPHGVASLDWIEPTVGELARPAEGPSPVATQRREEAEAACRAALEGASRERFELLLGIAQRWVVVRRDMAEDFTVAWPTLRRAFTRMGEALVEHGRTDTPADVFHLTRDEIVGGLGGDASSLTDVVDARRRAREAQRSLEVPISLGTPTGPWRKLDEFLGVLRLPAGEGAAPLVLGVPASAGTATGAVRIVDGPDDFPELRPGEILVAAATAPAWTPLFALAAGVVTDGGSPFAHAAVVAREYGIPAVVGTGDATRRLATGDVVVVDGARGTVERV